MERLWKKIHLKDSSFSTDWHFWITGCSISAMHQSWWWLQLWWWWWRWLWLNCETCTAEALEGGRPPRIQTGQNIRSGRDLEMKIHHQPSTTKANNSKKRNMRRYSIDFWVPIIQIIPFFLWSILNTFWDAPQNFFFEFLILGGIFSNLKKWNLKKNI